MKSPTNQTGIPFNGFDHHSHIEHRSRDEARAVAAAQQSRTKARAPSAPRRTEAEATSASTAAPCRDRARGKGLAGWSLIFFFGGDTWDVLKGTERKTTRFGGSSILTETHPMFLRGGTHRIMVGLEMKLLGLKPNFSKPQNKGYPTKGSLPSSPKKGPAPDLLRVCDCR